MLLLITPQKKERYSRLLSSVATTILSLDDAGIAERALELGETSEINAEIKAKFYAQKSGLPVFSEDEALYVDFLPPEQQPGVHVRRINGKDEVNDGALLAYWEAIIANVPQDKRTGKWHITYCFATPDGKTKAIAIDHPILFFSPSSKAKIPGWPMSSLQGPIEFGKPHSELTDKERKSHNQVADDLIHKKLNELIS